MLDKQMLEAMPPGTLFATGTETDVHDGLHMANTGRELRWVAVRRHGPGWCIYCHFASQDIEWIRRHGDKVCFKDHIRKLVPCDDDAFKLYEY